MRAVSVTKKLGIVEDLEEGVILTEEERELYKEALKEKNRNRFSRNNIDSYVSELLTEQGSMKASALPLENKRDMIRMIYISLYGNNRSNCYRVERSDLLVQKNGFHFRDFKIVKV